MHQASNRLKRQAKCLLEEFGGAITFDMANDSELVGFMPGGEETITGGSFEKAGREGNKEADPAVRAVEAA
ncbi:hypothetical protein U9M48_015540 [Paspalum notatum var. saurae]|uniref:Uncharacterized protein n=1 Tax=Paspalum notatum var. saurae TaxID=547442 RepID=A0AAQ3T3U7_PASNO